jgi:phage anti-repressor protein
MNYERLDIVQVIKDNPLSNLTRQYETKLIQKVQNTFTNEEEKLFLSSFYCYLKYDSKKDFVINLEDVWKWCGFSRKEECKRVLNKHFTKDIDYKIIKKKDEIEKAAPQVGGAGSQTNKSGNSKNLGGAGLNKETVLMNVETFKGLCMIAGTSKSKEIRKYYLKLEELMHEILNEETEELKSEIEKKNKELLDKETELHLTNKKLQLLEKKPDTYGFLARKKGYVYMISDNSKSGHYKIGMTTNTQKRLQSLNTSSSEKSLNLKYEIECYDAEFFERTIQSILQPFNICGRREWFYFTDEKELNYAICVMNKTKEFLNNFNLNSYEEFIKNFQEKYEKEPQLNYQIKETQEIKETNNYKLARQQATNNTGKYKGVCWSSDKNKWKAELKKEYTISFLGYYENEKDAAKAYNDYALFVNKTENKNYVLNNIPNYISQPRDVPNLNKEKSNEKKSSKYIGVSYDSKRKYYVVGIKFENKTYNLGRNESEEECAKIYNQQALYFNNHFNTNYNLNDIPDYKTIEKDFRVKENKKQNTSTKYFGVTFNKTTNKFRACLVFNKKQIHLGFFENELDAAKAYNKTASELNETYNKNYKINEVECEY